MKRHPVKRHPVSWYEHTVHGPNVKAAMENVNSIIRNMSEKTNQDILKKLDALCHATSLYNAEDIRIMAFQDKQSKKRRLSSVGRAPHL